MKAGFYICKTLLACDPDVNRRSVYYTDGKRHSDAILEVNREMAPWTAEQEKRLHDAVIALNGLGVIPAYWTVK